MSRLASIKRRIDRYERGRSGEKGPHDYADDPVGYFKDILGITLWDVMAEAARAILEPPHRVMLQAGHKVGKSMFVAGMTNWFHDSFRPSRALTTGPSFDSVKDIVWAEIRKQRRDAGLGGLQPKAPEMGTGPDHTAKGISTNTGERFQGRHGLRLFIAFDEAVGIDLVFWNVARTMVKPEEGHFWLASFNPTDTTSQAYREATATDRDGKPVWRVFVLDCLKHPNIDAQLRGDPPPIPAAVTLSQIADWLDAYGCDPIRKDQAEETDLEWPPDSGQWWRQSPEFLARCRGVWPEQSPFALWSELVWRFAEARVISYHPTEIPEIGVDVARYGDDFTAFHVRCGPCSLAHWGKYQGWSLDKTVARTKELAIEWAAKRTAERDPGLAPIDPKTIPIKVDDDGVGGGVSDFLMKDGWLVVRVSAATCSSTPGYPNKRSELWFQVATRARMGLLSLAGLNRDDRDRLKQQAMACEYALDAAGRRVIMPKDKIKEKIGRSPDDMDALNLAYLEGWQMGAPMVLEGGAAKRDIWTGEGRGRRLFGG